MTAQLADFAAANEDPRSREVLIAELERYKRVVRQVNRVAAAAADGDLEPRLLHVDGDDELAEMQHRINHLLDQTDAFVREAGASLTQAAVGNFHRRLLPHGLLGAFRRAAKLVNRSTERMQQDEQKLKQAESARLELADDFETSVMALVESLTTAASSLRSNADGLASVAETTSNDASSVADISEASSERLNVIAVATEELTATVGEIEKQTTESSYVANAAVQEATRSYQRVESLSEASERIHRVVNLINEVAEQTRLLALNANIEAARAGEAGRGFAVVASEVKDLAVQTAGATDEIQEQINAIQAATKDAVAAMHGIEKTISQIANFATTVETSVSEQKIAAVEISGNVSASAAQMGEMNRAIEGMIRGTRETSESASSVRAASLNLTELAGQLRAGVTHFASVVRAG